MQNHQEAGERVETTNDKIAIDQATVELTLAEIDAVSGGAGGGAYAVSQ